MLTYLIASGFHMDRSNRYRRFAKECLELARTGVSEKSKAVLLQMAHVWSQLADKYDRETDGDKKD